MSAVCHCKHKDQGTHLWSSCICICEFDFLVKEQIVSENTEAMGRWAEASQKDLDSQRVIHICGLQSF